MAERLKAPARMRAYGSNRIEGSNPFPLRHCDPAEGIVGKTLTERPSCVLRATSAVQATEQITLLLTGCIG